VEVELKSGTPDLLDAAAAGLAAAGATPSRSASKLARVLYGEPS
jgi:inorganic triphosphatase YgiF